MYHGCTLPNALNLPLSIAVLAIIEWALGWIDAQRKVRKKNKTGIYPMTVLFLLLELAYWSTNEVEQVSNRPPPD